MKKNDLEEISYKTLDTSTLPLEQILDALNKLGAEGYNVSDTFLKSVSEGSDGTSIFQSIILLSRKEVNKTIGFNEIGVYHNLGLEYININSKIKPEFSILDFYNQISVAAKDFCSSNNLMEMIGDVSHVSNLLYISHTSPEYLLNNPQIGFDKFIGINNMSVYTNGDLWKGYLTSIKAIFTNLNPLDSVVYNCKKVISDTDSLLSQFNNDTQLTNRDYKGLNYSVKLHNSELNNLSSEIVGGLLYIIRGSANYWKDNYSRFAGADTGDVDGIIQADALGFLLGWGAALWDDAHSPGGVQESGSSRRIGQGMFGAMNFSGGAAWGALAQRIGNTQILSLTTDPLPFDQDPNYSMYFNL
jgi:hypothetical protein